MYGCESWTVKKAEHQRIDVFELWCWRRYLRVPWTARRWNQSILMEMNAEYSLGRTDAKASILCPPDVKSQLAGKGPDAGKDWGQGKRASEVEMVVGHHRFNWHEFEQTSGDKRTGKRGVLQSMEWQSRAWPLLISSNSSALLGCLKCSVWWKGLSGDFLWTVF